MKGLSPDAAALFTSGRIRDHRIVTYCEIRLGGLVQATPTVLGGSVTVDVDSAVRRRASIDILAEPDLIPDFDHGLLNPGRCHLHLWRGIDWQDGRPGTAPGATRTLPGCEMWPLGVFLHTETVVANSGNGLTLQIGGGDLSRRIQRAGWTAPYAVASGVPVSETWEALIVDRWPDAVTTRALASDGTTPELVYGDRPGGDPWADANALGSLIGAESYVDTAGQFVLATIPVPGPAVVEYQASLAGDPTALLTVERRLDADKGYSAVVAESNRAGGDPLRSVVYDVDPLSPTYSDGDYGLVPLFVSTAADTQEALDTFAAGLLTQKQAASDAVTVEIVANPAHEERDVIRLVDAGSHLSGLYTLDGFTIGLGASDTMKATVRRVL